VSWLSNGWQNTDFPDILGSFPYPSNQTIFSYILRGLLMEKVRSWQAREIYWRIGALLYGELMMQQTEQQQGHYK
jgi:hypothetical protein